MPSRHCRNYDGPINVTGCARAFAVEPKGLVDQKNQEAQPGREQRRDAKVRRGGSRGRHVLGDHERAYLMTLCWYDVGKACRMSGGIASFLRLLSNQARGYLVEEGVPSCRPRDSPSRSNVPPLKLGTLNSRQERLRAKGVGPRWPDTPRSGTIRYMAVVGDRVEISSRKVGEAPRDGVVTGVTGSLLRVRWSTGEESTVVPSMGSLTVVGKQSGGDEPQTADNECFCDEGSDRDPGGAKACSGVETSNKGGQGKRPGDAVADRPKGCQGRRAAKEGQQAPAVKRHPTPMAFQLVECLERLAERNSGRR